MSKFDPFTDPDAALSVYNRQTDALQSAADSILYEYLSDQSSISDVIFDIETTELITKDVKIRDMQTSVATAMLVDSSGEKTLYTFYDDSSVQRGAPIRFLTHILDRCIRIVAYNGIRFDLVVLAGGNENRLELWRSKCWDPFARLRDEHGLWVKLDALLQANGLEQKSESSGAVAPELWKEWVATRNESILDRLERYNVRDVTSLAELVSLESIHLPGIAVNPVHPPRWTFSSASTLSSQKTSAIRLLPIGDSRGLLQNSPAWHAFRSGKIGASAAAAFVRLDFRKTRDDAFEQLIAGGSESQTETEAMLRGRKQESIIAKRYSNLTGARLRETGSWVHPSFPWLFASPDRLILDINEELVGLLEVKSVSKLSAEIPSGHLIQVQLQLACCPAAKFVEYLQVDLTGKYVSVRVRRDNELLQVLIRHLANVYESARPVLMGEAGEEEAFVDDAGAFGRRDELELAALIVHSKRLFTVVDSVGG